MWIRNKKQQQERAHPPTCQILLMAQTVNTVAMHTELIPIVLHLWTQWHCLGLLVNILIIPIVNYTDELPALSLLLIFQLGYLGVLKNL